MKLNSINEEQRLYVMASGGGYSCYGFDVLDRKARAVAVWIESETEDRAEWAAIAVDAFSSAVDPNGENDRETVLADLYADLRHYADTHGIDWQTVCARGTTLYTGERDRVFVRHMTCKYCKLDIEGFSPFPFGEWRDRGNNTTCPSGLHEGGKHVPYGDPYA